MKKYFIILFVALTTVLSSCDHEVWYEDTIDGSWGYTGYDPDLGSYFFSMTFRYDGTCTEATSYDFYPQYNYMMNLDYDIDGNIYDNAVMIQWGVDFNGYPVENVYSVTLSGRYLYMTGISGDYAGTSFVLEQFY